MTGHGELLATTHTARFDEDDVAANGSPDEPNRDAGFLDAFVDFPFGAELRHAEEFAHDFGSDDHVFRPAFGQTARLLADDGGNLALEIAHARFPREAVDDFAQPFFGELQLVAFLDAVFGGLLGDQIFARDVDLLLTGVAGEFDDLHAVAQGLRDGIHPVGRGDEGDLREVERHIEIVIAEGRILFRVEDFHQRGGRVAAEVAAELVDFVEHHDGVVGFAALQALNNLTGQSADVRPAMSTDFRFIVHAPDAPPHEFPPRSEDPTS